jgi:hypothetical protein
LNTSGGTTFSAAGCLCAQAPRRRRKQQRRQEGRFMGNLQKDQSGRMITRLLPANLIYWGATKSKTLLFTGLS